MTNYNEKLDEVLDFIENYGVSASTEGFDKTTSRTKAKQAITSLIKELVAESKPQEIKAAINSECLALLNELEEEQELCCSNHHKNSVTFVPFVSLDVILKAKEKYFEIPKKRIEERPNAQP